MPDIPPVCDPTLGWGHAFKRGGWACHLADLTYHWRDQDVIPMAKATYDVLVAQSPGSPRNWNDLRSKVEAFAMARSKWEKDDWFVQEKFSDRRFLQEVSLPDCAANGPCPAVYATQRFFETWNRMSQQTAEWLTRRGSTAAPLPSDIMQLYNDYAEALVFQRQDIKAKLIDIQLARFALARALHVSKGICPGLYDRLQRSMFGPGFINGWGARQPTELCELAFRIAQAGQSDIPCDLAIEAAENARPVEVGANLQQLAKVVEGKEPLYLITTSFDPRSEGYVAFVRFIHLPRSILMLTAHRIGGVAKITGKIWVSDQ
jgi:hypothetical protein